jgi:SAM-dependent methyltransferase
VQKDRIKWNEKYRQKEYPDEPSHIVKQFFELAAGKKALDIAAGNGRNSLFLAGQGFSVDALDISDEGLKLFAGRHPDIHPICTDLDTFDIPGNRYDLIVNVKFLNRRLFPFIQEGLRKDGILIFETFVETEESGENESICRDYLLGKNELLHAFLPLHIIFYQEAKTVSDNHDTSYLASLVAAKGN